MRRPDVIISSSEESAAAADDDEGEDGGKGDDWENGVAGAGGGRWIQLSLPPPTRLLVSFYPRGKVSGSGKILISGCIAFAVIIDDVCRGGQGMGGGREGGGREGGGGGGLGRWWKGVSVMQYLACASPRQASSGVSPSEK